MVDISFLHSKIANAGASAILPEMISMNK